MALCKKESATHENEEAEAGELGVGVDSDDSSLHFDEKLEMSESALQMAWSIINDTYRSNLCLPYPPHLIAVAAIYLTQLLHPPSREINSASSLSNRKRSSPSRVSDTHRAEEIAGSLSFLSRPGRLSPANRHYIAGNYVPITPTATFLGALMMKMRGHSDISHPPTARPAAVNKLLEQAQTAG
ncbi:hypothetical protein BDZ89DRAFT_1145828 [Hymenopellis radicata]|nr:hypothetical protein BDZ89DRAFT_1145828 [Hymenopellis radicata]